MDIASFDLRHLGPDFYADPYPTFHALRAQSPIMRMPDGSVLLTRHADLIAVYRDAQTFSSDKQAEFTPKFGAGTPLLAHHTTSLIFNDPPLHTRVRKLMMGAMTRRAIDDMEPGLIALVDGLLDTIAAQDGGDLIADFAAAIPIEVIGNLLVVPHSERGPLRQWSLDILGALEPRITPEMAARGNQSVTEFIAYLKVLVDDRRKHPGDPAHDVLTRLIEGEVGGEKLSEAELLQNCIFILNAGHETTTNLIGNALVTLLQWPEQHAQLKAQLAATAHNKDAHEAVLNAAVDEFLRFEAPVQLGNRRAMKACTIGDQAFEEGTLITLGIAAANRDPAQFESPDVFDPTRDNNKHLAFAYGIHQCAGLSLARLEGRVAIGRFVQRFANYRLSGEAVRAQRARFRGFLTAPFAV
jgi:cytochrome P450